jgi:ribonuclease E
LRREIIICEAHDLAVVLEDGKAVEFFLRHGDQLVGDIIWGQVEAIVPGIEAAFVDIGQDRNGFIHVADLPAAQAPRKLQAAKQPAIRVKERLLVQIAKAPTGTKGARLTGRLTIPGRFLVLVPDDNRVSISRRITDARERERLRRLTLRLKDPGHGLIVRTEAVDRTEADLRQDINDLIDIWADILHQVQIVAPPALLHRDSDLVHRVLRDAMTAEVERVVVDTAGGYTKAREILAGWMPEMVERVTAHEGSESIMTRYHISEELEAAISPKVWLPSGGYIVIEHTEALTVIDVNSGRLTQSKSLADTVLRTNVEAAAEVARQLRLRDIGGIIVIDFISMDDSKDRSKVWQAFNEALKQDKSRPQVTNFSEHGLIEVSRRRQGQNLLEQLTSPCEGCGGTGRIRHSHLLPELVPVAVAELPSATPVSLAKVASVDDLVISDASELLEADLSEQAASDGATREGGRRRRRRRGRGRGRQLEDGLAVEDVTPEADALADGLVVEEFQWPDAVPDQKPAGTAVVELPAVSEPGFVVQEVTLDELLGGVVAPSVANAVQRDRGEGAKRSRAVGGSRGRDQRVADAARLTGDGKPERWSRQTRPAREGALEEGAPAPAMPKPTASKDLRGPLPAASEVVQVSPPMIETPAPVSERGPLAGAADTLPSLPVPEQLSTTQVPGLFVIKKKSQAAAVVPSEPQAAGVAEAVAAQKTPVIKKASAKKTTAKTPSAEKVAKAPANKRSASKKADTTESIEAATV